MPTTIIKTHALKCELFLTGAIKAEVGQPLFFYITGSNKLLNDISIS